MLTSIPRPQPLTWMKPSQHNSQLSQFNYLMDTGHSWWNVLIRWFSFMMIVRKMIASHTNWNISAFLLFARNLALTRIMDWRRRWDIYCLYIVVLTLHCCRQRIPTLCTLSTSSHEECDWQIIANDSDHHNGPMLHSFAHFMRTAAGRSGRSLVVRGAVPGARGVSASGQFWRCFESLLNNRL